MTSHNFDLEIFNEKGDFSNWQQKMRGILVKQKVSKAIDDNFSADFWKEQKEEADELAYTCLTLF